jgi:hypothetical protein
MDRRIERRSGLPVDMNITHLIWSTSPYSHIEGRARNTETRRAVLDLVDERTRISERQESTPASRRQGLSPLVFPLALSC